MNRPKILIVDDNRDLADGLADILEVDDHEVTVVYRGEDGVARYREQHFDLTFMDVKLPGIDGLEALREIRKLDPEARVIMITGFRVDQLLAQAIDDGAVRVLRKPVETEDVLAALREVRRAGIVLVADGDPDFADGIELLLREHGYEVLLAHTGPEAVERTLANPVDVLVLDLRRPILAGLEVYLELKRQGRALPTIIVTGHPAKEGEKVDVLRSLSVTGCLLKPFDPEELLAEIDKLYRDLQGSRA